MLRRIGSVRMVDSSRAEFDDELASKEISQLAKEPGLRVIQSSAPVRESIWDALNDEFFSVRPDVELRVYGHYSQECDLSFAGRMTNVRRFAADSLMNARNVENVGDIQGLESLSLGIFELQDLSVLELVNPELATLRIGATRSKKPDLAPVARFENLNTVFIEGHTKNIEVLSGLHALGDLTLRSITTENLEYLRPLNELWSLDIKLGGIRSLVGVEGKASIKYLELWQVRGYADAEMISRLPGLQHLLLQSLPHIVSVPSLRESQNLRRITLINLKGMKDFTELEWIPNLEEFELFEGMPQDPEQLVPLLRNASVRKVVAGFGSQRKNDRFEALREQYGKSPLEPHSDFEYR